MMKVKLEPIVPGGEYLRQNKRLGMAGDVADYVSILKADHASTPPSAGYR